MDYQNTCGFGIGNCPVQGICNQQLPWYSKFIKPALSFTVSVMLVITMSHLCEKYSSDSTFRTLKSDINAMKNNIYVLSNDVRSLMESRDELKYKLKEMICIIPKLSEALLLLRNEVSEGIDNNAKKLLEAVSPDILKRVIKHELDIYDADKIGKVDYALETSGGMILTTRNTENYLLGAPVVTILGIPLCSQQNFPRAIIQTGVLPGQCWAFKGSTGSAVIQLIGHIYVSGFTLEHISRLISPTGETTTAPRDFSVLGLQDINDQHPFLFGKYTYDNAGPTIQYFEVQNKQEPKTAYSIIELKIHSNSGNNTFTCIYRIRVHGTPAT